MKKFFAVLMALVLVLSMGVTAFAAGETGSITITNAIDGETKKPPFVICDEKCIRCGSCKKICPISAITN